MISFLKQISINDTDLYLIMYNNMIIGSIIFEYDMITKIDININFYDKIKTQLLNDICDKLRMKELEVICDKSPLVIT